MCLRARAAAQGSAERSTSISSGSNAVAVGGITVTSRVSVRPAYRAVSVTVVAANVTPCDWTFSVRNVLVIPGVTVSDRSGMIAGWLLVTLMASAARAGRSTATVTLPDEPLVTHVASVGAAKTVSSATGNSVSSGGKKLGVNPPPDAKFG